MHTHFDPVRTMNKGLSLLALCALVLTTVGAAAAPSITVVTSTTDLADFARIIGGDHVSVSSIVRGPQNPHYIDVKPSYMMKLRSADVFLVVGMQLELWSQQLIDGSRNANLRVVDCSRGVHKLEVPTGRVDASQGDVHPLGNPHYWLDPHNVRPILEDIVEAFSVIDPDHSAIFRQNQESYLKILDQKQAEWEERLAQFRGAPIVTYHSSFSYFLARFGIEVVAHIEPKPGIPPTPSHTASVIQMIRERHIAAIGVEQFFDESVPERIATAAGAKVVRLSTSVEGREGTDSYISLIDFNISALASALGKKPQ